ncbi:hypothetical protein BE15_41975 [Sorangium cellulosum]|uniref:Secreted protein n=2 Tax=Sorangium cellulosum TaxID=56 RepID=A0A150QC73_SORCE|nr:hypothetical protein BE15_41975 [Sorangium cellulosum]
MMAGMKTSSLSRSLVLVALPALAGCRSEAPAQAPAPTTTTSPTPVAPTSGAPAPTGSAALDGSGAASQPRCAADADCVVSCARPEQCCDQLCPPCNQAFHRDALAAHEAWRARSCAAESCPVAKCMAPKEDSIARCSAGQCTVERVPRAEQ